MVIFLAGHTTVRGGRFCLLLPNAALPDQPIAPGALALRAPVGDERLKDADLLPYIMIDFNLKAVDALQRVVIIDACEAEAIYDNLRSRQAFRQYAERDVRGAEARTSYILATRRGVRAGEAPALEHGLLTYTLLRGMGERGLRPIGEPDIFRTNPTADLDGNGWIETAELQEYARRTIPRSPSGSPGCSAAPAASGRTGRSPPPSSRRPSTGPGRSASSSARPRPAVNAARRQADAPRMTRSRRFSAPRRPRPVPADEFRSCQFPPCPGGGQ